VQARCDAKLEAIVRSFLDAEAAAGHLPSDVYATDMAAILVVAGASEQHDQISRMLNLTMDSLRPSPAR
jgi:hypothetical protein